MRDARWDELLKLREQILIALEGLRKNKQIGSAQEAKVRVATSRPEHWLPDRELLATLCNVSEVVIVADTAATGEAVTAEMLPIPNVSVAGIIGRPSGSLPLIPRCAIAVCACLRTGGISCGRVITRLTPERISDRLRRRWSRLASVGPGGTPLRRNRGSGGVRGCEFIAANECRGSHRRNNEDHHQPDESRRDGDRCAVLVVPSRHTLPAAQRPRQRAHRTASASRSAESAIADS